jgi:hypothetical protein
VISGVAIAAFQWSVLYKRIQKSWRWLVFSALGWIGGTMFLLLTVPGQMTLLAGPFLGAVLGVVQWLILRRELEWAGWWMPISILAWTTGLTFMPGLLTSGALPGALTGLTLVILFRYSSTKEVQRA